MTLRILPTCIDAGCYDSSTRSKARCAGDAPGRIPLSDHYVARVLDLLDLTTGVLRSVHP